MPEPLGEAHVGAPERFDRSDGTFRRQLARDLTGPMPAHPVGHDGEPVLVRVVERVLVQLAATADVGLPETGQSNGS